MIYDNIILLYDIILSAAHHRSVVRKCRFAYIIYYYNRNSHHRRRPRGRTLISRSILILSELLWSSCSLVIIVVVVVIYTSLCFFSLSDIIGRPLSLHSTPPRRAVLIILYIISRGIYPNTCSTTFASALYDFKKQSIMRTGAPLHRHPDDSLQNCTHPCTAQRPASSISAHTSYNRHYPPPPAGTCALCQHFGVFYCGYKRVSPSEPLSNNTGPLC